MSIHLSNSVIINILSFPFNSSKSGYEIIEPSNCFLIASQIVIALSALILISFIKVTNVSALTPIEAPVAMQNRRSFISSEN